MTTSPVTPPDPSILAYLATEPVELPTTSLDRAIFFEPREGEEFIPLLVSESGGVPPLRKLVSGQIIVSIKNPGEKKVTPFHQQEGCETLYFLEQGSFSVITTSDGVNFNVMHAGGSSDRKIIPVNPGLWQALVFNRTSSLTVVMSASAVAKWEDGLAQCLKNEHRQ